MKLTKSEAALLLPEGETVFAGTDDELAEVVRQAYFVLDDAPYPYYERAKMMGVLARLAGKLGYSLDGWEPLSIHEVF